jgi:hypothetical protein
MPDPYTRAFAQRLNALSAQEFEQAFRAVAAHPGKNTT